MPKRINILVNLLFRGYGLLLYNIMDTFVVPINEAVSFQISAVCILPPVDG